MSTIALNLHIITRPLTSASPLFPSLAVALAVAAVLHPAARASVAPPRAPRLHSAQAPSLAAPTLKLALTLSPTIPLDRAPALVLRLPRNSRLHPLRPRPQVAEVSLARWPARQLVSL